MGAEQHEKFKDHTKHMFHKTLEKHGYTHVSTTHVPTRFGSDPRNDHTQHNYKAPEGHGKTWAMVWQHHDGSKPSWFHYHEQTSNGIMSPGHGDTRPGLDRTIQSSKDEWRKKNGQVESTVHPMRALVESLGSNDGDSFELEYDRHGYDAGSDALEDVEGLADYLGLKIEHSPLFEGGDDYAVILFKPSAETAVRKVIHQMAAYNDAEGGDEDPLDLIEDLPEHDSLHVTWDWKHFDKDTAEWIAEGLKKMGFRSEWDHPNDILRIFKR